VHSGWRGKYMHVQVRSARNFISWAAAAAARPKNPPGSIIRAVYFGGSVTQRDLIG